MAFFIPVLLAHLPLGLLGFKLEDVLISTGPWVLVVSAIIVFIESGVLFPVLPGDSLIDLRSGYAPRPHGAVALVSVPGSYHCGGSWRRGRVSAGCPLWP